jgi:hypothetical protein
MRSIPILLFLVWVTLSTLLLFSPTGNSAPIPTPPVGVYTTHQFGGNQIIQQNGNRTTIHQFGNTTTYKTNNSTTVCRNTGYFTTCKIK